MKWVFVTGFLVTLVRLGGGKVPPSPEAQSQETHTPTVECQAGTEWESNCHYCHCSQSGVAQCLKQDTCEDRTSAEPIRCRPDTTFRNDCNSCLCLDDGKPICTRMFCLKSGNVEVNKDSNSKGEREGEELGPPITKSKTKKSKAETDEYDPNLDYHNLIKRSVCKPNQEFQSDCNSCKCSPDGQRYTCTQAECLEKDMTKEVEVFMESEGVDHIERHSVCRPRNTFYIGCNTCNCNFDGTDYSCTNKPCPLPEDVELFHELRDMKPIIPYKENDVDRKRNPRNILIMI